MGLFDWNKNDDDRPYDEVRDFLSAEECPDCGNFMDACKCQDTTQDTSGGKPWWA